MTMTERSENESSATDGDENVENSETSGQSSRVVPPPFVAANHVVEEDEELVFDDDQLAEITDDEENDASDSDPIDDDQTEIPSDEAIEVIDELEILHDGETEVIEEQEFVSDEDIEIVEEHELSDDEEEMMFAGDDDTRVEEEIEIVVGQHPQDREEELLFAEDDEVFFEEVDEDLFSDDDETIFHDRDEPTQESRDEFDRPTDEHVVVIDEYSEPEYAREISAVTSEHEVVGDHDYELMDDEEVVSIDGNGLHDDDMIDFQEAPTGQTRVDHSATQEVAPLDQNIFDDDQDGALFPDATVEISEKELLESPSFSEAQRAAAEARQHRIDEVRKRRDSGGNPLVPLHTPSATLAHSGSHPSANTRRQHTSELSGSHNAAMSSPHADLDKQLRWLLALLVIALVAALLTLAVLLGAFDGNSDDSEQTSSEIDSAEESSDDMTSAAQHNAYLLSIIDRRT